jgi:molybdopterin converting factor subunit 1
VANILYFGRLSDVTGTAHETLVIPETITDTAGLRYWLDRKKSAEGALLEASVRLAVNSEIVIDPHPISDKDEIAFMPPVGGG